MELGGSAHRYRCLITLRRGLHRMATDLEHQDRVERWPAALATDATAQSVNQGTSEYLKVDHPGQALQWITRCAQGLVPVRKIKETGAVPPSSPPLIRKGSQSGQVIKHQSFSYRPAFSVLHG